MFADRTNVIRTKPERKQDERSNPPQGDDGWSYTLLFTEVEKVSANLSTLLVHRFILTLENKIVYYFYELE